MSLQRDGCQFPLSFHLVNDQGDDAEVKPSGGRIEMKSCLDSVFQIDAELELVQIDCDGAGFGVCRRSLPFPMFLTVCFPRYW